VAKRSLLGPSVCGFCTHELDRLVRAAMHLKMTAIQDELSGVVNESHLSPTTFICLLFRSKQRCLPAELTSQSLFSLF